jgi:hypothetical protein
VKVFSGRYAAFVEEPVTLFLVGLRIHRWRAVHQWLPLLWGLMRLRRLLAREPRRGMLGAHVWLRWREILVVQYWSDYDQLERFALERDGPHVKIWRRFNIRVGANPRPAVGVWHECYRADPGDCECVYSNMPRMGLARATTHVKATSLREGGIPPGGTPASG